MNLELILSTLWGLVFLLVEEVVAPKSQVHPVIKNPSSLSKTGSQEQLKKSEGNACFNFRKKLVEAASKKSEAKKLKKKSEPEPPPKKLKKKPDPEPEPPKVWKHLTSVAIEGRLVQINGMKNVDHCKEYGNTDEANSYCAMVVDSLDFIQPKYRAKGCERITGGKCHKTGTKDGKEVHECICHPYTERFIMHCLPRPKVDTSQLLLFKDCVANVIEENPLRPKTSPPPAEANNQEPQGAVHI